MPRTPPKQTLTFTRPTPQTPGFLRRQKQALYFQEALKTPSAETIDELVAFLADYVTVPTDRADAEAALWQATEDQFSAMLTAITGNEAGEPPLATSGR